MKAAIVQRQRELLATALVVAVLLATPFVSMLGSTPASALPPTLHETTTVACNNTFNGTKFPLQYVIDSTPSANPVGEGASFTQSFHVTALAAAQFLNGVYAAVGAVALPILPDQATITPVTNATGPDVSTGLAATFTIPKPAVTPVTADVSIDLGTVVGTYTAGTAPGPATFSIKGDAWSPSDTIPPAANQTEPAWTGTNTLTTSGKQTYETTSLAGGLIKATVVCMGGSWTATPSVPPTPRTIADGHLTNASTTLTSATANFTAADVGAAVTAPAGVPVYTTIASVTNATTAVLSKAATATNAAASVTIAPATTYGPPWIAPQNTTLGTFGAVAIAPPATTTTTAAPTTTTTAAPTTTTTAAPTTTTTAAPTTTTTAAPTTTTTAAPTTTTTAAPTTTTTAAPTTTTTAAPTTTTTAAPTTTTTAAPTTTTTAAPTTTTTAAPTTTTTAAPTTTTTAAPTTTTTVPGGLTLLDLIRWLIRLIRNLLFPHH